MYKESINIFEIDAAIQQYYESRKFKKDNYLRAFIRWRTLNQKFIQPDGSIRIDSQYFRQVYKKITANSTNSQRTSAGSWSVIGPKYTYASGGGAKNWQVNVYCMDVFEDNPQILYCGTETGVIFKSTDKGQNWVSVSDELPEAIAVTAIAIDPNESNRVFAYRGALLYSDDGGTSWNYIENYPGGFSEDIKISRNSGRIFVSGVNGLFYSDDNGATWLNPISTHVFDLEISANNQDSIVAVSRQPVSPYQMKLFISDNGGLSFVEITNGLIGINLDNGARIAMTPADPKVIYVYALNLAAQAKLLKSVNGGGTWSVMSNPPSGNGQGFYDLDLMVSPYNSNHIIVGTQRLYKSLDGGLTFLQLDDSRLHVDAQCMKVIGSDAFIATDGGINHSTDFFTLWTNHSILNNGLTASHFWGYDQGWNEDIVVGGRYHNGNTTLYEGYGSGNALFTGGVESATGHIMLGRYLVASYSDDITRKMPDNLLGTALPSIPHNTKYPNDWVYGQYGSKLVFDPRYNNIVFVGNGNALWKSINKGATYNLLHVFPSPVYEYEISRSNPNVIYLVTEQTFQKSLDGGSTWIIITTPITFHYAKFHIAISHTNENELFICFGYGSNGNKVFKSLNGGSTWINITTAELDGIDLQDLILEGSVNSGIYLATTNGGEVFYKNDQLQTWINFNSGLPKNVVAIKMLPFFRDGKIRIASNRGIWESPLYEPSMPIAQPQSNAHQVKCGDTVNFEDFSILNHTSASWKWDFPGASYYSSNTARNPKVVYKRPGEYDVTLTITDGNNLTNTKSISGMIMVMPGGCLPDTLSQKCINIDSTYGNGNVVDLGIVNISDNFTITCWVKPRVTQTSFAQIVGTSFPNSRFGLGFAFMGYTQNTNLVFTHPSVPYQVTSSINLEVGKWNHVALTFTSNQVKIYHNGKTPWIYNGSFTNNSFNLGSFYINPDIHGQYDNFRGQIEELKFYNVVLSQEEIREKMHLILDYSDDLGLVKYYQFNKTDQTGLLTDLLSSYPSNINNASLVISNAPVASGQTFRHPNVSSGGHYNFPGTGVELFFPQTGVYPNGELVTFKLNANPEGVPDTLLPIHSSYWIINNYGSNSNFSALDSMKFSSIIAIDCSENLAADFSIYKRPSNSFDSNWGSHLARADIIRSLGGVSTLIYLNDENINSFGQLMITSKNEIFNYWIGGVSDEWENPANWSCNTIPDKYSKVVINAGNPHNPKIRTNVMVGSLKLNEGAILDVGAGYIMKINK